MQVLSRVYVCVLHPPICPRTHTAVLIAVSPVALVAAVVSHTEDRLSFTALNSHLARCPYMH